MKFSNDTLTVLKNYAQIYDGLEFKQGNVLRTIDGGKNIQAQATIPDQIPQEFHIADLNKFLSVLSLDESPSLEFDDKHVYIIGNKGRSKITYRFCHKENIKVPDKNYALPTEDIKFDLSEEDFKWVMRSATILQSPHIAVIGDGTHVYLKTMNLHDDSQHTDNLDLGEFPAPQNTIKIVFKTENWKMIPGPYTVRISNKGISHFSHKNRPLEYWIATEITK